MTAIEGTIVTTAMPTIVGSLHGMEIMNWVFSIYLLTNAMLTPSLTENIVGLKWDENQFLFLGHYCLLSVRYFAVYLKA